MRAVATSGPASRPALPFPPRLRGGASYSAFLALVGASVTAAGIGATIDSPRTLMPREDYAAARSIIDAETRIALAECRLLPDTVRQVCRVAARAEERVRQAELAARYTGTVGAASHAALVREKGRADVARAQCVERSGPDRRACLDSYLKL